MKLKRLSRLGSALILGLSSLFIFATPGTAHALGTTLYWCNTSSGDFNTTTNWNTESDCSSGTQEVPVTGDSLVFDNSNITADLTINNDITGLDIASITFQGTNSNNYGFTLTGDAISLDDGITDAASTATADQVSLDITLTQSQSFTDASGAFGLVIGNSSFTNILNLSTYSLTMDSNFQLSGGGGTITVDSQLEGSGNIVLNGTATGVYNFQAAANGYTGNTTLDNGGMYVYSTTGLGTGSITIDNGANLTTMFSSTSPTFSNAITVGGDGGQIGNAIDANDDCPAPGQSGSCADGGSDTFSGAVTLTANTTLATAGDSIDFTGDLSCSTFTMGLTSDSNGSLTGVPSGCLAASSTADNSDSGSGDPGTPDTGTGLSSTSTTLPIIGGLLGTAGIYIVYRRIKQPASKRR